MKLIYIYGPPAVGKLTVAKEFSKITGYKIMHNNLTADLVEKYLKYHKGDYWKTLGKIRLGLLEGCMKDLSTGLIYTQCYSKEDKGTFIKQIIKLAEKNNSKILFVKLNANKETLQKRVTNKSRKIPGKITSKTRLKKFLTQADFFAKIPFVKSLEIDTDKHTAKQSAELIAKHYKLKQIV